MTNYPTDLNGHAAGRKVLLRLKDFFDVAAAEDGSIAAGVHFVIDRPYVQPFNEEELEAGAVHIRCVDTSRGLFDGGTLLHRATFDFDIGCAEAQANAIGARQAEIEAWIVSLLHSDITLGGLTKDINSKSVTADEQLGAEAGIIISSAEILFLTPRTNLFTISGPLGLIS